VPGCDIVGVRASHGTLDAERRQLERERDMTEAELASRTQRGERRESAARGMSSQAQCFARMTATAGTARAMPIANPLASVIQQSLRVLPGLSRADPIVRHFSGGSGGRGSSIAYHRRSAVCRAVLSYGSVTFIVLGNFFLGWEGRS